MTLPDTLDAALGYYMSIPVLEEGATRLHLAMIIVQRGCAAKHLIEFLARHVLPFLAEELGLRARKHRFTDRPKRVAHALYDVVDGGVYDALQRTNSDLIDVLARVTHTDYHGAIRQFSAMIRIANLEERAAYLQSLIGNGIGKEADQSYFLYDALFAECAVPFAYTLNIEAVKALSPGIQNALFRRLFYYPDRIRNLEAVIADDTLLRNKGHLLEFTFLVPRLLDLGADPNQVTYRGYSPLFADTDASAWFHLFRKGADVVRSRNAKGEFFLPHAMRHLQRGQLHESLLFSFLRKVKDLGTLCLLFPATNNQALFCDGAEAAVEFLESPCALVVQLYALSLIWPRLTEDLLWGVIYSYLPG